jgi:hypothetical protein
MDRGRYPRRPLPLSPLRPCLPVTRLYVVAATMFRIARRAGSPTGLVPKRRLLELRIESGAAQTRYARSGDASIAYQVVGEGPPDLLFVSGFVSHLEPIWEEPTAADYPLGFTLEQVRATRTYFAEHWGDPVAAVTFIPSMVDDHGFLAWWARYLRLGTSPRGMVALMSLYEEIDVQPALPLGDQEWARVAACARDRPVNGHRRLHRARDRVR